MSSGLLNFFRFLAMIVIGGLKVWRFTLSVIGSILLVSLFWKQVSHESVRMLLSVLIIFISVLIGVMWQGKQSAL